MISRTTSTTRPPNSTSTLIAICLLVLHCHHHSKNYHVNCFLLPGHLSQHQEHTTRQQEGEGGLKLNGEVRRSTSTSLMTFSSNLSQQKVLNKKCIFIGNIDWTTVSKDDIYETLVHHDQLTSSSSITKEQIQIKPKTNKKRDENKLHGGSLTILFHNEMDAIDSMKILIQEQNQLDFSYSNNNNSNNNQLKLNPKSKLNIRWSMEKNLIPNSNDVPTTTHPSSSPDDDAREQEGEEVTKKLIKHRKSRALKYQRQRKRIGQKTDDLIQLILSTQLLPSLSASSSSTFSNSKTTFSSSILPIIDTLDTTATTCMEMINWSKVPYQIDPMRGGKIQSNSLRGYRKQVQVEAFVHVLKHALLTQDAGAQQKQGRVVVADLGCGAGNLSIPLAWFLLQNKEGDRESTIVLEEPSSSTSRDDGNVQIVAVDINKRALEQLRCRAKDMGLENNIQTVEEDLLNLINDASNDKDIISSSTSTTTTSILSSCSAVVSLHACGAASDLAINAAVTHSLPFAISPCCIGKVKSIRNVNKLPSMSTERSGIPTNGMISYPRSRILTSILEEETRDRHDLNMDDYSLILTAADYSMGGELGSSKKQMPTIQESTIKETAMILSDEEKIYHQRGRMSKLIVETDRLKWAQERGYYVRMMELPRLDATYPKREILLGAKLGSNAAYRISRLPRMNSSPSSWPHSKARTTAKSSSFSSSTQLRAKLNYDNDEDFDLEEELIDTSIESTEDRMDLDGFSNYLAPYAFALILSVGVTAAIFKFILLDY